MRFASLLAAGVLLASTPVVAACGQNSGCVRTALAVRPARMASPSAPLTLKARLTSGGRPLAGFRLAFSLVVTGPTQLVGKSGSSLQPAGHANTDADGVATYTIPDGVDGVVLPKERAVKYEAELLTANPIDGKQYCDVHAQAPLTPS